MTNRFVNLQYQPTKNDLITTFRMDPINEKLADMLAAESSTGTWTKITTDTKRSREKLKARVYFIDKDNKIMKVAYNQHIFEKGNIPQMLSDFAGNIFGIKAVDNLRLLDITLPKDLVKSFPGPTLGLEKIREKMGITKRPLVGTIVKPKVGLTPEQHAEYAYQAWLGGCDLVKDDENLTSQRFCIFEERIEKKLQLKEKAETKTGEKKIYAANITASFDEMVKRADFVKEQGGKCLMIDIITAGFSAVQSIAKRYPDMIIYGHRAMHAAFTRLPTHGIAMLVIAKLARLAGVEHLHSGTAVGKMEGEAEDIKEIDDFLRSEWYGLKKTIPVKSGGLHPGLVPKLMEILGNNVQITAGGGIAGHPSGVQAGAKAMRQAVNAYLEDTELETYAQKHEELKEAVDKWGTAAWKKEQTYSD
ncbi:MAG: type III ribulose-bisphosphate carboxylase [Asgard group archaeon]|nr:type III ribulose-bisphosphate carboxylase [Asgard group archaeon]